MGNSIVMGCEDDKLPHSLNSDVWEIEEERRIVYVGITRPKTNLYLTWAENRDGMENYLLRILMKYLM